MTSTAPPASPQGLQEAGAALWADILGTFELAPHELVLLLEACRTVDLLEALQVLIDRDGPVLPWGDGTRANPAVVEARQNRITLARLIASLGIPVAESETSGLQGSATGARGSIAFRPLHEASDSVARDAT